jgi:hypothetical protein
VDVLISRFAAGAECSLENKEQSAMICGIGNRFASAWLHV